MPRKAVPRATHPAAAQTPHAPASKVGLGAPADAREPSADALESEIAAFREQICLALLQRTGHDFRSYKTGTLLRRITRRIQLNHLSSAHEYLGLLEHDAHEPGSLLQDLLIGVTQFFRDPEVFDVIAERLLPQLLAARPPGARLRIWVPGCSSGEEAFSQAMLVREHLDPRGDSRPVQIFATDIDSESLARARQGRFGAEIAEQLSAERLARFFAPDATGYQASRELREMCVFSEHNLIRDPPFSSLDLISCRNVLIYFSADLQRKLVPLFHFALVPGGHLVLGPSEGLPGHTDLFEEVSARCSVFRRRECAVRAPLAFPVSSAETPRSPPLSLAAAGSAVGPAITQAFERMLLQDYMPASAVVNEAGDILSWAGRIHRVLEPPAGAPTNNLLDATQGPLRVALRAALSTSARTQRKVVRGDLAVEIDGRPAHVRLYVRPLPGVPHDSGLFAVVILESGERLEPDADELVAGSDVPLVDHLENELRTTRADLQSVVEQLETANEELKASNEELVSTNEELQSSNEELQTSREEIQSINEELQHKVEQLGILNSDLQNLFASTSVATLFLDRALRIEKFTPAAAALFQLVASDVGRPLAAFAPRFRDQDLVADAASVLETRSALERQVRTAADGSWFVVRVLPYRTVAGEVAGVVVTFVDVSALKRVEQELRESERRFRLALHNAPVSVAAQDRELKYVWAYGQRTAPSGGVIGLRDDQIFTPEEAARLTAIKARVLSEGIEARDQMWLDRPGGRVFLDVYWEPIRDESGAVVGVSSATMDLTANKLAEEALRESEARFAAIHDRAPFAIALTRLPEGTTVSVNDAFLKLFECAREEVIGRTSVDLGINDPRSRAQIAAHLRERGSVRELEVVRRTKTGEERFVILNVEPVAIAGQQFALTTVRDVSERKRAEKALRFSEDKFAKAFRGSTSAMAITRLADGTFIDVNTRWVEISGFTRGDALGQASTKLNIWKDPEHRNAFVRNLRERGLVHNLEAVFVRSTGEEWTGLVSAQKSEIEGEPVIISSVIDISERKRTEEALHESEQRLRLALDAAELGAWELEEGSGRLTLSPRTLEVFGVDGQTAPAARTLVDYVVDEDRPGVQRAIEAANASADGRFRIEYRIRRAGDGALRWVVTEGRVLFDADRKPVRRVGVARDMTEQKLRDERIRKLSEYYAVLSKVNESIVRMREPADLFRDVCRIVADDGHRPLVWIGRVEGRTVVPVAASGRAVGYLDGLRIETDGEYGRGPTGTCVRDARPVVNDDFDVNPATQPWRRAALEYDLRASAAFPLHRAGAVVGAFTVYASEAGTFDEEQVRLIAALCADLSYALDKMEQERALEESERDLRVADQRKNEFLAVLSHELRNPLAPIRNSLHLLERIEPGSDKARRAQTVIARQVGQMARLVDDLLDVTRITRGKIQIQRAQFELGGLLQRTLEDHRSEFESAEVQLETCMIERPLWIDADKARISQAVGNLLQNAAKFTGRGGRVTLSLDEDVANRMAVIRVRDNGIGIAAEVIRRLFQPFMQADSSLDRSKGGLGLGLALVKGLVELHGGTVEVRSDGLGKGAEFTIRLPLQPEPALRDAAAGASKSCGLRRVLIIEDNVDAAHSLREVLELTGHRVEVAHDGDDGLARARRFTPQVVLCDIGLPGMDGYAVARAIRRAPEARSTFLVALTGYALPEDLAKAREAGFDEHLAKPPDLDKLERILAAVGMAPLLGPDEV